ncbi:diguanylate cyclase [uncultured Azohydromonas sp.]|uniref:sensor domain-containing diguanylate cyclase n=1 Tax=uncultured Azohydromonas sp. TaxID=487342 RepID=UPI0026251B51|nr:diguanylate cyclase [uncultured Azohydromonas sp.]
MPVLRRLQRWSAQSGGSLKLRTTLSGIVALILGILLTTVVLVQRAERDTLASRRDSELHEAAHTAAVLSSRMVELQQALRLAAGQIDASWLHDRAALERFLMTQAVLRNLFGNIFVATPDGHVRAYAERDGVHAPAINVRDRTYFQQTLAEGRPVVSEALDSRVVPEPVVVLAHPLQGAKGVDGVIGGALRLVSGDLMAHVLHYQGPDDQSALLVVSDLQGRILAHPDPSLVLQPLEREPRLEGAWAGWEAMRSPLEPAGITVEVPGAVVSVAAVSGPQWLVWRVLPEENLLGPLHQARRQALDWAAVIVLLASLVLLLLTTWQLRPLRALARRAQRLFDTGVDPHAGWPEAGGEIGHLTRVLRHVGAERVQLEASNAELMKRLQSVMAAAPVGIAFTRAQRFELVNAELCRLLGYPAQALSGAAVAGIGLPQQALDSLLRRVGRALHVGRPYRGEWQLRRADGSTFWAEISAQAANPADTAQGLIWTVVDIDARVATRTRLQWSAHHDPLTGLANRAAFEQRLHQVFGARPRSMPAALVAIDLDHFKPINDSAGHAAGDAMLKAVATAICSCVRAGDLVARLGGDEFMLLLERCPGERALPIANAVCAAVAGIELPWEGRTLRVGASAGVAALQADMTEVAHWLRAADRACYDAKGAGRGRARAAGPPASEP